TFDFRQHSPRHAGPLGEFLERPPAPRPLRAHTLAQLQAAFHHRRHVSMIVEMSEEASNNVASRVLEFRTVNRPSTMRSHPPLTLRRHVPCGALRGGFGPPRQLVGKEVRHVYRTRGGSA